MWVIGKVHYFEDSAIYVHAAQTQQTRISEAPSKANKKSAEGTPRGLVNGVEDASAGSKGAIDGTGVTELTQGGTPVASDSLEGIASESNHVGNRQSALFEDFSTNVYTAQTQQTRISVAPSKANKKSAKGTCGGLGDGVRDASASSKCAVDGTGVTELTQEEHLLLVTVLKVLHQSLIMWVICMVHYLKILPPTFTQHRHSRHVLPWLLAKLIRSLLKVLAVDLVMG